MECNCTTFEELCEYGALYVIDKEEESPFHCIKAKKEQPNVYEHHKMMSAVLHTFNRLGFWTYTSQPGKIYKSQVFKTLFDRKYKNTEFLVDCTRKQRALVRGYATKELATHICETLWNHSRLFVRAEHMPRTFNGDIQFGSVAFINNTPVESMESEYIYTDDESIKSIPDSDYSFPLHRNCSRPLKFWKNELRNLSLCYFDGRIVHLEIFDIDFGRNDCLWETLENVIRRK